MAVISNYRQITVDNHNSWYKLMAKLSAKGNGKELMRLVRRIEPDDTFTSGIKKTIVIFESGKILQKSQWETQYGKQDTGYKVYSRKLKKTFNLERVVNHFQSLGYHV